MAQTVDIKIEKCYNTFVSKIVFFIERDFIMTKYKIIFADEELDDIFDTYEDAQEQAVYYCGCSQLGAEILHMSNPGDYDYDEENWQSPEYEIIEVEE